MTAATRAARWTKPTLTAGALPKRAERLVRRSGARRTPFILLVVGLLVGGLCALLALNTAAAAAELRRQSLTGTTAELSDDVQQLKNQLAARQAPQQLANAATELGMVPNTNPAFLQVQPDGSVKVLGQPGPATRPAVPPLKPTASPTPKPTTTATKPGSKPSAKPTPGSRPTPSPKPSPTLPPIVSPVEGTR